MYHWVTQPNFDLLFLIPLPLVVMLALAFILVARHRAKAAGLAVYAVAPVAALLAFGLRAETRNLLQLVPFLCLGGMLAAKSDWDAPPAMSAAQPVHGEAVNRFARGVSASRGNRTRRRRAS